MTAFNILDYVDKSTRVPGVTDDSPAFEAMLVDSKQKALNDSPHLEAPPGLYLCSRAINLHQTMEFFGYGNYLNRNVGTIILFGPNAVGGIVSHEYRTTDDGGAGSVDTDLGDANGSLIKGFSLWGPGIQSFQGPWTNPNAKNRNFSCLWLRTATRLENIFCGFSSGPGLKIVGYAGGSGSSGGQPSGCSGQDIQCTYNALDGLYIEGSDANLCNFRNLWFISNGGSGARLQPFFNAQLYDIHTRDNGQWDPTRSGALNGTCFYDGHVYYLVAGNNEPAQRELAKTTVPGTNDEVWRPNDGIANYDDQIPHWAPGLDWRVCGAVSTLAGNPSGRIKIDGLYTETGQIPCQMGVGTLVVGGPIDVGFDPTSECTVIQATGSGLASSRGFMVSGRNSRQLVFGTGGDSGPAGVVYGVQSDDGSVNAFLQFDGKSELYWQHNHSPTSERKTLASDRSPIGQMASLFDRLVISHGAQPWSGISADYVDNPGTPFCNYYSSQNDLLGRRYGKGDVILYVGAPYTGSMGKLGMGLRCADVQPPINDPQSSHLVGIYDNTDPTLPTAILVEFGEPVNPMRFQDLPYIFQSPKPGQTVMISNCGHQNIGQPADGNGNFIVRVSWNVNTNQWIVGI